MDAQGWALVIGAIFTGMGSLTAAVFAGWLALKSNPTIHRLVNNRSLEQDEKIKQLEEMIREMNRVALEKAEARAVPPPGVQ